MLPPKFIQKFYSSIVEEEIYVAGLNMDYENEICLVYLNSSGPVSNFGRIWSILQKNYLGAFDIYKINKKDTVLPEFQRVFNVATEEKITDAKYVKIGEFHKIYLSFHSGKILYYIFSNDFKKKQTKFTYVLKEPINKLHFDSSEMMIVVGERSIRIFNSKKPKIL